MTRIKCSISNIFHYFVVATAFSGVATVGMTASGCASGNREQPLISPAVVAAPYDVASGDVIFAVVPMRNETGNTNAPITQISEQLVQSIEEIRGVRAVPLSRTLAAMRALELRGISGPKDLQLLADALNADGVVFGSVSGYNPYTPSLTLSIGLFARPGKIGEKPIDITLSTRDLKAMAAEPDPSPNTSGLAAASTWSDHLDGKNHGVQLAVRAYAQGRVKGASALTWRRYLSAMPLFTEFATSEAVRGLMREEWVRVGTPMVAPGEVSRPVKAIENSDTNSGESPGTKR